MAEFITFGQLQEQTQAIKTYLQSKGLVFTENTVGTYDTDKLITLKQLQLQAKAIKDFLTAQGFTFTGNVVLDETGKLVTLDQMELQTAAVKNELVAQANSWQYDADTKRATYGGYLHKPSIEIYGLKNQPTQSSNQTKIATSLYDSDTTLNITSTGRYFSIPSGTATPVNLNSKGDKVTILTGSGNDTIFSTGNNTSIKSTEGDNYIKTVGNSAFVSVSVGADTIISEGDSVKIYGGAGNDSIQSAGNYVSVYAGAGADTIYISGDSSIASLTSGSNTVSIGNSAGHCTIYSGSGNDSIVSNGNYNTFYYANSTGGTDTIKNFNNQKDSIYFASVASYSTDSINAENERVLMLKNTSSQTVALVNIGKGFSDGDDISINFEGTTYFYPLGGTINDAQNITLDSAFSNRRLGFGSGDDTITILESAENVSVNAGNGNNSITSTGNNRSIAGGSGADTISSSGSDCYVTSSTGNDSLSIVGGDCTIDAGAGDNVITVSSGGNLIISNCSGDINSATRGGNNSIYGAQVGDTLSIVGGGYKNVSVGDGYLDYVTGGYTTDGINYTDYHTRVYGNIADSDLTVETVSVAEDIYIGQNNCTVEGDFQSTVQVITPESDTYVYPHYLGNTVSKVSVLNKVVTVSGDNASIYSNSGGDNNSSIISSGNNASIMSYSGRRNNSSIISSGDNASIRCDGKYYCYASIISSGNNATIGANSGYNSFKIISSGDNAYITCGLNHSGNSMVVISGGSATVVGYSLRFSVTGSNAYLADYVNVGSSINVAQGVANSTIFPAKAAVTITNNSDGNIYYYAGTRNATDSLSALGNNDTIYIADSTSTVTDSIVESDTQLQITSGTYNNYINIFGKTTGDTLNVKLGDANRIYTIGTGFSE